ncbi:MAG TPA: serine/threonine-protein kinase [Gemmatimonadaceae bacterium]|nr:serine/threonine-protein kinase [Gemmatimonadaceae bacterium]HRQ77188.1 serine/threonine-protein kinase [Gemmatimonadaceae bacterium]
MSLGPDLRTETRFRLLRELARGGMATVYEAEQLGAAGFSKRMAVKIIHDRFAEHPEWLQLFIDEAKLSANLVHGNIVQIYFFGNSDRGPFIAMELIKGITLRTLINTHRKRKEALPPDIAAYCASRICRALDFAHHYVDDDGERMEIVHRDVSPGNVMLTWDGHVKLADFGIAKARTMFDPSKDKTVLLGKKHYMAPEQLLGKTVDARADIFSMGVVLFELFALKTLFTENETLAAIEEVVISPTPDVRSLLPLVDTGIRGIISGAISKEPAQRPNAAKLGLSLDRWNMAQGTPGSPERLQQHLAALFPESYAPPTRPTQAIAAVDIPDTRPDGR